MRLKLSRSQIFNNIITFKKTNDYSKNKREGTSTQMLVAVESNRINDSSLLRLECN